MMMPNRAEYDDTYCYDFDLKEYIEKQKKRNYTLIKNLQEKRLQGDRRTRLDRKRCNLAIYRLHNTCNVPEWEIARKTGINTHHVRQIIGQVFINLCLNDRACIFKELFRRKR